MAFIGASINPSPVIAAKAAAAITGGAGKAVKFDEDGNIVLCSTAGELSIGILPIDTEDEVAAGDEVTVQIKDIGKAVAGGAIPIGSEVAVVESGKLAAAVATNFVIGYALSGAGADGDIFDLEIRKGGYKA